jgi:hypothetical protein
MNWSYERDNSDIWSKLARWFWGSIQRRPHVWTTNCRIDALTKSDQRSALRVAPHVGNQYEALGDPKYKDAARSFFPNINGLFVIVGLGAAGPLGTPTTASVNFQRSITSFNNFSRGNTTSLWT